MKINTNIQKTLKGVTLIELSVVIAVILVLLSVLFIGASYYKDSADKAACTINQNAIKKAGEAYMNIESALSVSWANLTTGSGPLASSIPSCPGGGNYNAAFAASGGRVTSSSCSIADHN